MRCKEAVHQTRRSWYRNQPRNRWPGIRFITDDDMDRLRTDTAAGRVYTNGQFSTWVVRNESAPQTS